MHAAPAMLRHSAALLLAALACQAHAALQVSPAGNDFQFGTVAIGARSAPQTFTWKNTGTAPLPLGHVVVDDQLATCAGIDCPAIAPADFAVLATGDTCSGTTLAAGASCSAQVQFAPGAQGGRTGRLAFAQNSTPAGTSELTAAVVLMGTGGASKAAQAPLACVLDWAERRFPHILGGTGTPVAAAGMQARCYAGDAICLGASLKAGAADEVYLLQPQGSSPQALPLGPFPQWAALAQCAGTQGPIDITDFDYPYERVHGVAPIEWQLWPGETYVIRTQAEFERAWDSRHVGASTKLPLPSIDFSHHTLVGVALPVCTPTITRVRQAGDALVVHWSGGGGICATVPGASFVLIPRTDLPVTFERAPPHPGQ